MKELIISYSFSGNNAILAKNLAEKASADFTEIKESKKRNVFTIVLDTVFNRTPKILPLQSAVENYDHIIFVAPIWFGKIASPFRQAFRQCRDRVKLYSFVSISGGANGALPRVEKELIDQLGESPYSLFHYLISDLLPESQRGNQKALNTYRLSNDEALYLSELALQKITETASN